MLTTGIIDCLLSMVTSSHTSYCWYIYSIDYLCLSSTTILIYLSACHLHHSGYFNDCLDSTNLQTLFQKHTIIIFWWNAFKNHCYCMGFQNEILKKTVKKREGRSARPSNCYQIAHVPRSTFHGFKSTTLVQHTKFTLVQHTKFYVAPLLAITQKNLVGNAMLRQLWPWLDC